MTSTRSVSPIWPLISSISRTTSYGTPASACGCVYAHYCGACGAQTFSLSPPRLGGLAAVENRA
eukprot:472924-Prymnesium_polylepis.1